MTSFVVVIPSRYASVRLPGKPLRNINGRPMIQHVYERGKESSAREVIVATDDQRIADACDSFGATVCMTGDQHRSGSERVAEVCDIMDWGDDTIVVNLQGDEPAMPATLIDQCAALLADTDADIGTLASPVESDQDFENPNVVKAVLADNGDALYFSRSAIPHDAPGLALHHHGIYAYRVGVLRRLVAAAPSPLEIAERLEQLRALSLSMRIRVAQPSERPGIGVDTEEDLQAVARAIS